MFLSLRLSWLACLLAGSALFSASPVRADAKQCVLHNNDAAQLRDERHLLAAREAYRACLADHECPAMVRSECDAALADIKAAIPTLLVAVVDAQGHDLAGATLQVDGRTVLIDGSTIEVDPGVHELVASSGALSSQLRLMALESDVNRRVELVLQAPPPKLKAASAAPSRDTTPAERVRWPAYALGGVAALGAASFGYFGLNGLAGKHALADCKPHCAPQDVTRVQDQFRAADISLGLSLLALAGAGYWWWSTPQASAERAPAVSLAVSALPHAAGLSVRWVQ